MKRSVAQHQAHGRWVGTHVSGGVFTRKFGTEIGSVGRSHTTPLGVLISLAPVLLTGPRQWRYRRYQAVRFALTPSRNARLTIPSLITDSPSWLATMMARILSRTSLGIQGHGCWCCSVFLCFWRFLLLSDPVGAPGMYPRLQTDSLLGSEVLSSVLIRLAEEHARMG